MVLPKLLRLPLTVSAYSGGQATLTYTVPQGFRLGVVGLSVYPIAALNDHQVLSLKHNEYEAVKVSTVSSVDYGVPLAHVASYLGAESYLDGTRRSTGNRMKFWPGRLVFPGLSCEAGVSMIPLKENAVFTITVKRLYGSTSIDQAYLWAVPLSEEEHRRRCNGQQNVVDRPQWVSQLVVVNGSASSAKTVQETRWSAYDDRALRLRQLFATVYYDNSGLGYAADDADKLYLSVRDWNDVPLLPSMLENQDRVSEFCAAAMQSFDCARDLQLVIAPQTGLRLRHTRDAHGSGYSRYAFFSLYGSLMDATEFTGQLVEAA